MTRRSQTKKTNRKRYSKEFKEEALAMAESLGVPVAAKELGLPACRVLADGVALLGESAAAQ